MGVSENDAVLAPMIARVLRVPNIDPAFEVLEKLKGSPDLEDVRPLLARNQYKTPILALDDPLRLALVAKYVGPNAMGDAPGPDAALDNARSLFYRLHEQTGIPFHDIGTVGDDSATAVVFHAGPEVVTDRFGLEMIFHVYQQGLGRHVHEHIVLL